MRRARRGDLAIDRRTDGRRRAAALGERRFGSTTAQGPDFPGDETTPSSARWEI